LSMQRQLAAIAELVRALIPAPLAITSPVEARAVSALLLAATRGQRAEFQRENPFAWRLTQRVLARVVQSRGDVPLEHRDAAGGDKVTRRSRGSAMQPAPCVRS
jgi:hypothetical protein